MSITRAKEISSFQLHQSAEFRVDDVIELNLCGD